MNLSDIDHNFKVSTMIDRTGLQFYDVEQPPFRLFGVYMDDGRYRRMPESVAAATSNGVHLLHANTAGGRVRFVTDSPRIAIHAVMDGVEHSSHFTFAGKAGFDVYLNGVYRKTFVPSVSMRDGFESVIDTRLTEKAEVVIHFPLYSCVKRLFIGLQEGHVAQAPSPYRLPP